MDEQNIEQQQTPQNNENAQDNFATPLNVQPNNSQTNNNPLSSPETIPNPTIQNNINQPSVDQSSNNFQQQTLAQPGAIIGDAQQTQPPYAQPPQQIINNYENSYPSQESLPKNGNSKTKTAAIIVVVIVIFGGFAAFAFVNDTKDAKNKKAVSVNQSTKPSPIQNGADAAIDSFITAILNKDKVKADSLETKAMQATVQSNTGKTSFYDSCQTGDNFCEQLFNKEYLSSGTVKTIDYTAKDGTKGKQRVYTVLATDSQTNSTLSGTSKSTTTITFAAIEINNSWMIDDFNFDSSFSADASTQ